MVLLAASSSVGLAAMQIAQSVGATSITVTRKDEKIDELKEAGFAHVLQTGLDDITSEIMLARCGNHIERMQRPACYCSVRPWATKCHSEACRSRCPGGQNRSLGD